MSKKRKHTAESIRKEKEAADKEETSLWHTAFEGANRGTDPIAYEQGGQYKRGDLFEEFEDDYT